MGRGLIVGIDDQVYGVLDRDGSGWVSLSELQVLAGMHPDAVPPSALWLSRRYLCGSPVASQTLQGLGYIIVDGRRGQGGIPEPIALPTVGGWAGPRCQRRW